MKLIEQSANIHASNISYENMLCKVADAVALCYKANKGDTIQDLEKFVKARIDSGHVSVIEHADVTAEILTDRGVTHELVRHRVASYTQESTRYCNYSKDKFDNQLTFIIPEWMKKEEDYDKIAGRWVQFGEIGEPGYGNGVLNIFSNEDRCPHQHIVDGVQQGEVHLSKTALTYIEDMLHTEKMYMHFLELGLAPEDARGRLTNDLAAHIVMTANVREWRHVFELRSLATTGRPHPSIKALMDSLLEQFAKAYPVFFKDQYDRLLGTVD